MPAIDLSPYKPVNGKNGDATQFDSAFDLIQAVVNALDASNWASGKIFALDKLATGGATTSQVLTHNGTDWAPADLPAVSSNVATGTVLETILRAAPAGYLLCDGTAVSRATYAALFAAACPSLGAATVTIASPAVVTNTAHGLAAGERVYFTTTGALPTGLAINTAYFVLSTSLTADTFKLAATRGGAAINTSGSQSGVHTLHFGGYGIGDGTTTFNVPDRRGRVGVGNNPGGPSQVSGLGNSDALSVLLRNISHHHTSGAGGSSTVAAGGSPYVSSGSTSGDANNTDAPAWETFNYIVKT